jgi:acetyltransferase-like isoleucine patch superfamily enzyme
MLGRFSAWLTGTRSVKAAAAVREIDAASPTLPLPASFETYREYIRIDPTAVIAPTASLKIFNLPHPPRICLEIGAKSHIFSNFSILHADAKIVIGPRCQLGASSFVARQRITLEGDILMAWGVTIIDTDAHSIYWSERKNDVERCIQDYLATDGWDIARNHDWSQVATSPITIGARTWIGFNSIILKGVHIAEGCVIGAGSVVTRNIPAWHVAAGNPCRPLRKIAANRRQS